MKKRLFLFIFLLLIPTVVLADECNANGVVVNEVTLMEKGYRVKELEEAKIVDNKIVLNLEMSQVGDYIKYELKVTNNTNDVYNFDTSLFKKTYEYFDYTFETDNHELEGHESKTIVLNISYKQEIPEIAFVNNVFTTKDDLNLNLNSDSKKIPIKISENPNTGVYSLIILIPIITIIGVIAIVMNKKKKHFKEIAVICLLITIPVAVNALCTCELKVESNIKINECRFKLVTDLGSFSQTEDIKEICINDALEDYEYSSTMVTSGHNPRQSLDEHKLVSIHKNFFTEESYMRFYTDPEKTNLVKEVTLNDFTKDYYDITNLWDISYLDYTIDMGTVTNFYVTMSPDLQQHYDNGEIHISSVYTSWPSSRHISGGLYTPNKDIQRMIETMRSKHIIMNGIEYELHSFDRCDRFFGPDDQYDDMCDGKTYKARWEEYHEQWM